MAKRKRISPWALVAGVAAAYVGYKVYKAFQALDISDIEWEKLGEDIYYNYDSQDSERNQSEK
jgi:hypothetical protein